MTTRLPYIVQMVTLLSDEVLAALLNDATMQETTIQQELKAEQERRRTQV